jgi:hypothetical protein
MYFYAQIPSFMKAKNKWLATVLISFLPLSLLAQSNTSSDKKKSYGQVGVKYLSDNIYLGRKDSTATPYITPSLGYFSKTGFYISGSISYLPISGESRIDVAAVEGGYDFSIKDKFYAGVYAGKYFYNSESFAVKSAINTGLGFYAEYDFGILSLNTGLDGDLGSSSDIVWNGGVSHEFSAAQDKLEITPTAKFNAGTQNYYNSYFASGKASVSGAVSHSKGHGRGNPNNPPVVTVTDSTQHILSASQFKLLDMELSVPIQFTVRNFKFNFNPVYNVPYNPSTLVVNQAFIKEKLTSHFTAEIGIAYKF